MPRQWLADLSVCIAGGRTHWLPLCTQQPDESTGLLRKHGLSGQGLPLRPPTVGGYLVCPRALRQSGRKADQRRQRQLRIMNLL